MKYEHICKNCGIKFINYFETTKYCSRKCHDIYRKEHSVYKTIICPVCGNYFSQKHKEQIFCSVECRAKNTESKVKCNCEYCGKKIYQKTSEYKKNKHHYCSKECHYNSKWCPEDVELLKENYGKMTYSNMIKTKLFSKRKSEKEIGRKAISLGLTSSREWNEEELQIVKENYSELSIIEIQKLLPNRSISSIRGIARKFNLMSKFYLNHNYSDEENEILKNYYLEYDNEQLSKFLGRTPSGIAQHLYMLDLHRPTEIDNYKKLKYYVRSKLYIWKTSVLQNNNYTCQLSGERNNVVVHHIRSFNLLFNETLEILNFPVHDDISLYFQYELDLFMETFLELQKYYNEYICISEVIHKKFHDLYGYGNNTKEQWDDFINNYYK